MGKPKNSFRTRLPDGANLSIGVFATRNDPDAEVIVVEIRRLAEETWTSDARIAVYRSPEGNYIKLPDREKPSQ